MVLDPERSMASVQLGSLPMKDCCRLSIFSSLITPLGYRSSRTTKGTLIKEPVQAVRSRITWLTGIQGICGNPLVFSLENWIGSYSVRWQLFQFPSAECFGFVSKDMSSEYRRRASRCCSNFWKDDMHVGKLNPGVCYELQVITRWRGDLHRAVKRNSLT